MPAPFLPSRELVYAKDYIVPLSQDEMVPLRKDKEAALPEALLDSEEWSFVCSEEVFREELSVGGAFAIPQGKV